MFPLPRILPSALLLTLAVNAATIQPQGITPPASKGRSASTGNVLNLSGTLTRASEIIAAARTVHQKSGANFNTLPDKPVAPTTVTVNNGVSVNIPISKLLVGGAGNSLLKRDQLGFHQVFAGTGAASGPERDAAIEGTAYLTYTVVQNSTYNVDACLNWCLTSVDKCVFVNLYYEFNNQLLDFVFSEHSNLKCVAYADIHTAAEKTNFGGQQSYPAPGPLTYIQDSSGWALSSLASPDTPDGYEFVFGPTTGANNAPGYMGFSFIDKYDVNACAVLCNTRGADPNGGACQYFNIWRAVVNGNPTTYTCAFYYIPTDASTAVNYGQGDLTVTYSRGYRRKDFVIDGGFEGYPCSTSFCFGGSYSNWVGTSPQGGYLDASIFYCQWYAHAGVGSGLLGSANGVDALSGTLAPTQPLQTVEGKQYTITFFQTSAFSGQTLEAAAFIDVMWNGNIVQTIQPGYSNWQYYAVTVTAEGDDELAFHGGRAPAWTFLDDVHVFQL